MALVIIAAAWDPEMGAWILQPRRFHRKKSHHDYIAPRATLAATLEAGDVIDAEPVPEGVDSYDYATLHGILVIGEPVA